jgi:hypothetical protein
VNDERDFSIPSRTTMAGENGAEESETHHLTGASLLNLSEREIDENNTLLGDRFLCRGGGVFLVGPSGIGKSTLSIQLAAELGCGRPAFGIAPARGLRVLIIQAEDDEGDVIEMSRVVNHLALKENEKTLIDKNTFVVHVNDRCGVDFIDTLDQLLEQWPADIVIINPYESYLGDDIQDRRANTLFLRNWLNPLLERRRCGCIIVHHTPKTNFRDTSKWRSYDWMYAAAGAAGLTNWARGIIVIDPTEVEGVYGLICPKRGKRIGWTGQWQYWAHNEEGHFVWSPASDAQIAKAQKVLEARAAILSLMPPPGAEPITQAQLFDQAKKKFEMGMNKVRQQMAILVREGAVEQHELRRKGTRAEIAYKLPSKRVTVLANIIQSVAKDELATGTGHGNILPAAKKANSRAARRTIPRSRKRRRCCAARENRRKKMSAPRAHENAGAVPPVGG